MSVSVSFNGTTYTLPTNGEKTWGSQVTALLQDVAAHAVTSTGNALTAPSLTSTSSNPASSGYLKLANSNTIVWRNGGNSGNLTLGPSTGDHLYYTIAGDYRPSIRVDTWKYNVKDFGAKGDHVTDDTVAINLAMYRAYADDNAAATSGTINYEERPTVYFPPGIYKISNPLLLTFALNIEGDAACIVQNDATKDIFNAVNGVGYGLSGNTKFSVKGLCMVGGKDQVSVDSNSVNNTLLTIQDCYFINPVNSGLHTGPTHAGLTSVRDCFIWTNDSGGSVGLIEGGDETCFENCYAAIHGGSKVFQAVGDCGLKLNNFVGTPGTADGGTWVYVTGNKPQIALKRSRFGGEQGLYGVDWKATGGGALVVEDLSGPYYSQHPNFRFYTSPDYVDIDLEDDGGTGFWFDPSMTDANKRKLAEIHFKAPGLKGDPFAGPNFGSIFDVGSDMFCMQQVSGRFSPQPRSKTILASDYVQSMKVEASLQSFFSQVASSNNVTASDGTNTFGASCTTYTAIANPANVALTANSWLQNLAVGAYTLVVDCDCTAPVLLILAAQTDQNQSQFMLLPGDPSPHFYFNVGAATSANLKVSISAAIIPNGGTWTLNRVRLYKGRVLVPDQRAVVYGTGAPTAGYWQPGDEVIYTNPASGGAPGSVCTTGGFANKGNWATSTGYTRGDHIFANSATYLCVQSGTSSGSAGGPNSTSFPVVDGTCQWAFMKTAAACVFKAKGNLA